MRNRKIVIVNGFVCAVFLLGLASQAFAANKRWEPLVNDARASINEKSVTWVKNLIENCGKVVPPGGVSSLDNCPILIDVRSLEEYVGGHLFYQGHKDLVGQEEAVHIPRGTLEFMIERKMRDFQKVNSGIQPSSQIIVYCRSGKRGALAAETLGKMGYTNVINMEEGFKGWVLDKSLIHNKHGIFLSKPKK